MMWLMLALLVLILSCGVLSMLLLWQHLQAMQAVQQALRVWEKPELLASPLPEPGVFVVGEAETKAREAQLAAESETRARTVQSQTRFRTKKG